MPNEFNFWDFEKYNFDYYIKEENPLQEMPMPIKENPSKENVDASSVDLENLRKDQEGKRRDPEKLLVALENVETQKELELENLPETSHNNKNLRIKDKEFVRQGKLKETNSKAGGSKTNKTERRKNLTLHQSYRSKQLKCSKHQRSP